MAPVLLVLAVFVTCICFANGQSACFLPGRSSEVCLPLNECPAMLQITMKKNKSPQEAVQLMNSQCGHEENATMVCCPRSCVTPDGQPGNCLSIYSCPHLLNMLMVPLSMDNIQFINKSKCIGSQKYSVCCGPPRTPQDLVVDNCQAMVSSFPPDPKTECCGLDASPSRFPDGFRLQIDHYPWLAIIEYYKMEKVQLLCGGALISGRYVLTAAHCVTGQILELGTPKSVRLGEYDTKNDGPDCALVEAGGEDCTEGIVTVPIEKLIPHPGYVSSSKTSPNDIALIRLTQPAPYTDFIRPICLPTVDLTPTLPENLVLLAAGWGAGSATQPASSLKQQTELPLVGKYICEPIYKSNGTTLTSGQLCAGSVDGKTSKFDSGGPLMYENGRTYEVIGVMGYGDGLPNISLHTNVYEYNAWIRSTIVA